MSISYTSLPAELQGEAAAYVEHGRRPGALLMAVLDNNLRDTLNAMPSGLDGDAHAALLCALTTWAWVQAPCISRGAVEMTTAWMEGNGKQGRAAARLAAAAAFHARENMRAAEANGQRHLRVIGGSADAAAPAADDAQGNAYSFHHMADTVARFGALVPR